MVELASRVVVGELLQILSYCISALIGASQFCKARLAIDCLSRLAEEQNDDSLRVHVLILRWDLLRSMKDFTGATEIARQGQSLSAVNSQQYYDFSSSEIRLLLDQEKFCEAADLVAQTVSTAIASEMPNELIAELLTLVHDVPAEVIDTNAAIEAVLGACNQRLGLPSREARDLDSGGVSMWLVDVVAKLGSLKP